MKTIEEHIEKDKHLLEDPTISSAARRHYKEELHELEVYADHHHDEIELATIMTQMLLNCFVKCTLTNQSVWFMMTRTLI